MGAGAKGRGAASGTYVALLRGINVGGRNRLPMARLTDLFAKAGCRRIRTYIQSGNVVFDASPSVAKTVPSRVSASITQQLDLRVPIVTRKFTSAYLDRTLGTTVTIRNWRTTVALLDLVRV